jgi:hypothetical protein
MQLEAYFLKKPISVFTEMGYCHRYAKLGSTMLCGASRRWDCGLQRSPEKKQKSYV